MNLPSTGTITKPQAGSASSADCYALQDPAACGVLFLFQAMPLPEKWMNAIRLMRIPFSFFLMPVFWLSLVVLPAEAWEAGRAVLVFLILHLFLFPASNGYNSLADADTGPVGGLEKPPPVSAELGWLVLMFDLLALLSGFLLNLSFGFCVAVYWLASRAYSSPRIRLKRYPWISWCVVWFFQGAWTVLMIWTGVTGSDSVLDGPGMLLWPLLASVFMAGSYPLTQIYQHGSDRLRGDLTLSRVLGIRGTFWFAIVFSQSGAALLAIILLLSGGWAVLLLLLVCSLPGFIFLGWWMKKSFRDPAQASFRHAMRYNLLSAAGLSAGFLAWMGGKLSGISLFLQP